MGVGVNPPKTPVTKGSSGLATATVPNICKMPGPPAPFVPTPLPNIGKSGGGEEQGARGVRPRRPAQRPGREEGGLGQVEVLGLWRGQAACAVARIDPAVFAQVRDAAAGYGREVVLSAGGLALLKLLPS